MATTWASKERRALRIRKQLGYTRNSSDIIMSPPFKFAGTPLIEATGSDGGDSLVLLDQSTMLSDEDMAGVGIQFDWHNTTPEPPSPQTPLAPAGTPLCETNPLGDSIDVQMISTPQSMLHGLVIDVENEVDNNVITPTSSKAAAKIVDATEEFERMFQSSPLIHPDESMMLLGVSFLESPSLNDGNDEDEEPGSSKQPRLTPLPKMRNSVSHSSPSSCSPVSYFQSNPLTSQPDDSLLQQSMSSFIVDDESMVFISNHESMLSVEIDDGILSVERELFGPSPNKKEKKQIQANNDDSRVGSIQLTAAFNFNGSLVREKPLLTVVGEDDEGDDEADDFDNVSTLGLHFHKQATTPPITTMKKHDRMKMATVEEGMAFSPTAVSNFHQDSSTGTTAAPVTNNKSTNLISRWLDHAFGSCQASHCIVRSEESSTTTMKHQTEREKSSPSSSKMKRLGLIQRNSSPAEELSLARRNANMLLN